MPTDFDDADRSAGTRPPNLPADLADRLDELDASQLEAVADYARSSLPSPPTPAELVEARPGEEIVEIRERDGFTEVVKRQPCAEGCPECPHGPYLHEVWIRPLFDGVDSSSLHWEFLGRVYTNDAGGEASES
ncbi:MULTISPECIES: hypothetical protein [Halorussus]|uniref:hypothetical protein n=1 Tax=Halorussus TaxID=1070314 RepID=UPI0020A22B2A|nr:hypothetical protein [Halorussus vallis]USZ74773.1 hypothetical protein NGM07_15185 [Halorussus vallis]